MIKRFTICLLIAVAAWSCKSTKETDPVPEPEKADTVMLTSVTIEAKNNPDLLTADVKATIKDNDITALIPSIKNSKKLVVTFTTKTAGTVVKANDTLLVSGTTKIDFTKPVTYALTTPKGLTRNYNFKVKNFTGIPVFYLTTSAPVNSKDNYVTGTLVINTNGEFEQEKLTIPLQIKGRGNSTWGHPKKPYRLKFNDKTAVLGIGAAKNWVLLANYSDKTLMRTSIAFSLGKKLGVGFTPDSRFIEVVLNGEYIGSYLLTEQVEVHENRVNVPELKKGDVAADKITGGYLLEWDQRLDEEYWFRTSHNIPFTIKSPEDIPDAQFNYISGYVQQTEDAIFADNFADPNEGYAKYIDVNSFVNYYIIQEIMKNQDAKDFSSIFFYKDRGGKLTLGPLWDFDLAIGNVDYSDATQATGWWIKDGPWYSRLFEDAVFRKKVKDRWNQIKGNEIKGIYTDIDSNYKYINLSQQQNFKRWPILNEYVWPNPLILGTYDNEVSQIKSWLTKRITWLDIEINRW
ncbi:CotH kinase family protein [Mucilaginibacter sp. UR6-1]|uniref:CotH kinase family protein n=1 Tax=Mucilaginibacter sp. UR6-1 TaxID=1435643 RepID=UPI001E2C6E8B|nr:CotH kinase family protein [Mucilaginibacter sp. UR6-1]MCC8407557.1 CotH kinase family protein [Mucilaginibacter sp. UR6-1]